MNTNQQVLKGSKKLGFAAFGLLVFAGQACAVGGGGESVDSHEQAYGSCSTLRAWDGGNYQFTVAKDEVIQNNGHAYQATQAISYPNAECAPGAAAGWCAGWFTDLGPCGSASTSSSTSTTSTQSSIPQECLVNHRIDMMCAELAVAMAKEIGELNPLRDLAVVNNRVVLSAEGQSRCSNGCYHVQGILEWQDGTTLPDAVFSAEAFRTNLVSQWYEQQNYEADLKMNHPNWLPGAHSLSLVSTGDAYCGTNYEFQVNWQCSGGTSSSTTVSTSATYAIKGVQSGRCVDIENGSTSNSANVRMWDCLGNTAQQFKFEDMGGGFYRVRNVNSGKCLDVSGVSQNDGANILQYSCGTGQNQQFSVTASGSQVYLKARHSGKALDAAGSQLGANLQQYSYWGGDNQKFVLSAVGGSSGGSSCSTDTSVIQNRMKFFRPNNTVIDFMSTPDSIMVDPTGSLIDDGSGSGSGSCTDACMKFVASGLEGACCMCNGQTGTFQKTQGRKMECKP